MTQVCLEENDLLPLLLCFPPRPAEVTAFEGLMSILFLCTNTPTQKIVFHKRNCTRCIIQQLGLFTQPRITVITPHPHVKSNPYPLGQISLNVAQTTPLPTDS